MNNQIAHGMDLNDLAVFERVVALGSFTAAADALGLAKSTVSARIARLEARLEVRLLQRTTRSVRPTDDGELYYAHCRRVVGEARAADEALQRASDEPVGTLRITCPRMFAYAFLGPVVQEYLAAHPRVDVQLHLAERTAALVEEGFDLALRIGEPTDSSLVVRRLGSAPMVYVAGRGYLQGRSAPSTADELDEHALVVVSRGELASWPLRSGDGVRAVPVQGRLRVNSLVVAKDAAIGGLGVAFLPRFLVREALAEGALVEVLVGLAPPPMPVCALYPSRRHLSPRVRAFVDLLVARTEEAPPWE